MEVNDSNRMAVPRKRGRPSLAEIAAREPAREPETEITKAPGPPSLSVRCKHCGRMMIPRVYSGNGETIRYLRCTLCGGPNKAEYSPDGVIISIQAI